MVRSRSLDQTVRARLSTPSESVDYLRQEWLTAMVTVLRDARVAADLSQSQLAERLGTTQSSIARLERDFTGSVTLHRLFDYAVACNAIPTVTYLAPIVEYTSFASAHPTGARTQLAFDSWRQQGDDSSGGPEVIVVRSVTSTGTAVSMNNLRLATPISDAELDALSRTNQTTRSGSSQPVAIDAALVATASAA